MKSGLDGLLIGSICLDYVGSWAHVGLLDLAGGDLVELELQDQEGEEDRYVDANDDHIIVRVTRRVQVEQVVYVLPQQQEPTEQLQYAEDHSWHFTE